MAPSSSDRQLCRKLLWNGTIGCHITPVHGDHHAMKNQVSTTRSPVCKGPRTPLQLHWTNTNDHSNPYHAMDWTLVTAEKFCPAPTLQIQCAPDVFVRLNQAVIAFVSFAQFSFSLRRDARWRKCSAWSTSAFPKHLTHEASSDQRAPFISPQSQSSNRTCGHKSRT